MSHPIPENERERLLELEEYNILDSMPEQEYDDIAHLAAQICGTKISTVALLDKDRKWHKGKFGIAKQEVPRDISICSHTIMGRDALIVNDTNSHPVFCSIGMVTSPPHVRFYAGIPLVNPNGFALGTLCVIDTKPKTLSDVQQHSLGVLANQVVTLLELRRQTITLGVALKEKDAALEEVKALKGMLPMCSYCKSIRDDDDYWHQVESYLAARADVSFTHGCCPTCYDKLISEL